MKKYFFLLTVFLFSSFNAYTATENSIRQEYNLSEEAYDYLEEALSHLETGSVNRNIVDWGSLRTEVYRKAANAITPEDTYKAIQLALTLLNENHSFFMTPDQVHYWETRSSDQASETIHSNSLLIDNQIGYLLVPMCDLISENSLTEFALSIQQEIQKLDKNKLRKWVIDLRGNTGGNMWPMVLGLRPLINAETCGFFSDGSGEYIAWNFGEQTFNFNDTIVCSHNAPSYRLYHSNPQIAVLVDGDTCSSGEATTIAFLGGDQTRVFGQKTGGYTSANEAIRLSDGAIILLATTYSADRLGRIYRDGVTPDQITEEGDDPLQDAIQWLQ